MLFLAFSTALALRRCGGGPRLLQPLLLRGRGRLAEDGVHLEGNHFLVQQDCRYLIIIIAVCK